MKIDVTDFREVLYGDKKLYFDKKYSFHEHFGHERRTTRFPFYQNILLFLEENPTTNIYFTLNEKVRSFKKIEQGFLINMSSYCRFCMDIQSKTRGRIRAFLGQNLRLEDVDFTEDQKNDFIKANASERNVLGAIKVLDAGSQKRILKSLKYICEDTETQNMEVKEIMNKDFTALFSKFLTDKEAQRSFFENLPRFQVEILKSHLLFLETNTDKGEKFIQDWIDEEGGKFRKQRCLIFGIEYIDPKREGEFNRKRFDILAEQNLDNHVLIELKSPCADVFSIKSRLNHNGGRTTEYRLSTDLARAIPQILQYKRWYERASIEEIQAIGIKKKKIHKCVVVIGTRKNDALWKEIFQELKSTLNIEILTYTDLIDKLKNTIKNLEDNLKKQGNFADKRSLKRVVELDKEEVVKGKMKEIL